ncbi:MAG TPA: CPBP family intramembrane glutamic endopeptidase [Candidatus Kapabacteria bacterium]|nr:CPBP family intramembrane glutamic endopeptidase [Candidatus Kapabacteria bacterium]
MHSPIVFALASFAVITVSYYKLPSLIVLINGGPLQPAAARLVFCLAQLATMLPLTLLMARFQPLPFAELFRLRPVAPVTCLLTIVATFALLMMISGYLVAQEVYLIPDSWRAAYDAIQARTSGLYRFMLGWNTVPELLLSLLFGAVIPPLCEELLFRGLLQRSLERSLAPAASIAIAAIFFAAVHLQPQNVVAIAGLGAFHGFLVWRTRSIIPAIIAHATVNGTVTAVMYVGSTRGHPIHTATRDGFVASLPLLTCSILLFAFMVVWINRRHSNTSPASAL